MAEVITTTKNRTYKYIRSLRMKKTRESERRFTVEGAKSAACAVRSGMRVAIIAVSETFWREEKFPYTPDSEIAVIKDELFGGLCETKTPQGIIAAVDMPVRRVFEADPERLYIYCDRVSDPGNLGTIIRTADAAGFGGVLLSPGCAELYSPKTVRASMGSLFETEVIPDFSAERLFELKERGFALYCGALTEDSVEYTEAKFTEPSVIIVGNEANGASDEILSRSRHIIIPIKGSAESLNAAAAAAVLMYEAVRQRKIGEKDGK